MDYLTMLFSELTNFFSQIDNPMTEHDLRSAIGFLLLNNKSLTRGCSYSFVNGFLR